MTFSSPEERQKIIERIKKCLSLGDKSRNTSEHEAETAMSMARALMDQYQLSMEEIQFDVKTGALKEQVIRGYTDPRISAKWELHLSLVAARLCSVEAMIVNVKESYGFKHSIMFIGLKQDVELAKEIYQILRSTLSNMANGYGFTRVQYSERNSYCLGVVTRLLRRLEEDAQTQVQATQAEETASAPTSTGTKSLALVATKRQAIQEYIEAHVQKKPRKQREIPVDDNFSKGYRDGANVSLNFKKSLK